MNGWVNLCGTDGKVKARLNRLTGELLIKDHGDYHRWNVLDLCQSVTIVQVDSASVLDYQIAHSRENQGLNS